ncbi:unnamed protein product, partial [Anisakis simplex]|uniref:Transportin-3 n=1 Tax=Anisakis simplex TaxID=6269 RepID=A0A0M3KH50_ANISI
VSFADDPIIICVSKYDIDFCKKLVVSCAEQAHLAVPEWSIRSSLPLPQPIATCIIKENYVAMCYAQDGVTLCNTWFTACFIVNFELPFTEKQKNCVEIKHPIATCIAKYGPGFCNKVLKSCSELLNQPILPRTPGSLQEFLEPIAICISKGFTSLFAQVFDSVLDWIESMQ